MRVKGFTLIELIIVVLIVGILAAFAIPAWQVYMCESNGYTWEDNQCINYQ